MITTKSGKVIGVEVTNVLRPEALAIILNKSHERQTSIEDSRIRFNLEGGDWKNGVASVRNL